ncbi:MAG: hypothetical protein V8Q84_00560 [Bilophila sp.]
MRELDWIRYLALPLEPVMRLTGLPADLGIAWATGIDGQFLLRPHRLRGALANLPR